MNLSQSIGASDFRTFLEQELTRRNSANPSYSLRAFARDLGVDSSFLSKLLNGKRSMTVRTIMSLAPRLALSEADVKVYSRRARSYRRYVVDGVKIQATQEIESPQLAQVLDWYYLVILEMVNLKGFEPNVTWIVAHLEITPAQAQQALDDLIRLGVLFQKQDGTWKSELAKHTVSGTKFPRMQLVKKQIYEQALTAIPQYVGDHGTMTVAISEKRYEEAVDRIVKFRRELSYFLAEPDEKDKVYQILVSLFPISK